jgi:hypothetical protein
LAHLHILSCAQFVEVSLNIYFVAYKSAFRGGTRFGYCFGDDFPPVNIAEQYVGVLAF